MMQKKNELLRMRSGVDSDSPKIDDWWIKQASEGDSHAFSHIVRMYQRRITALGMGFFKNITDTEDFVQDVFIKIFNNLKTFRGESQFSTWITRIAYNTAINTVTRRKEYVSLANEEMLTDSALTPEEEQIKRVTKEVLLEAVKELPEQYAACLDLYFFHDLPYKEICTITDLPVNTIKSHIFRAKKMLRDKLIEVIGV
jgi:RNA polymerase sigma-70 factor (ECF subfamily)